MTNTKILALKYRPQEFKDLIGQEVMAQTIINAIKSGKTPNAYLLTGIRGVGKTTTARLIAKALNCQKNVNSKINCSASSFCSTCKEIIESNHIDILEMDAASKTGIDDVRELIENSKYSPTSAQFKIFIIDEVHMLSKQAFNGLLKTLEEPPPRLKFILATTEVRKIPVTILSRCQRFDLKRVATTKLFNHLKNVCEKEKGKLSESALKLIVRASEGSVRDAISLLDKAIISQTLKADKEIDDKDIRQMLGLADRSRLINLFKEVLLGNQKLALEILKELIENGLDSKIFLNDMLEILYLFSRRISLGPIENDTMISEPEIKMIDDYAKNINIQDIGLFWQLTIKTIDDLKIVSNENLTLEMYLMQLVHLKNLDKNFDLIGEKKQDNILETKKIKINEIKEQLKSTDQIKKNISKNPEKKEEPVQSLEIKSFDDLVEFATREKEVELKYDLERNVKLVSFNEGKIDISFNEKLNKNFIKNLTDKLFKWTGYRWIISLSKNDGAKSIYEKKIKKNSENLKKEQNSEIAKKILSGFPDAKLMDVEDEDA
jgi:DNA polymerase III subunit gamma/tau